MVKVLALVAALSGCAPTYSAVTGRCPTTTTLLGDFGLFTLGIAVATLKYNAGKHEDAAYVAGGAVGLSLADNYVEHHQCAR